MSVIKRVVLDTWAALNYKPAWQAGVKPFGAVSWVPDHEKRRVEAYVMLAAYLSNSAREYLTSISDERKADRREYGDAALIVDTIVDAILGEDVHIEVEGAGVEEGEEGHDPTANAWQEWFDQWDIDERPMLSVIEKEGDAVGLGDGVIVIGFDATKQRPTLTCYDPGFYFPEREPWGDGRDYPETVHICWDWEDADGEQWVRRITWRLQLTDQSYDHPWNDATTQFSCFMSDAVWALKDVDGRKVYEFPIGRAVWQENADGSIIRDLDLGVDFIPVVHQPNTIARKEHYGKSSLGLVLQILDEIAAADTDLALTARTTGFPPIGVEGTLQTQEDGKSITTYGPGTAFEGKVTVVDTSTSLDALLKYVEQLFRRLSSTSRVPETTLGRVDPSDVPSGFAMVVGSGPLKSMIRKMRLVRDEKDPLIFKFVARFAMKAGQLQRGAGTEESGAPSVPHVRLAYGPFVPTDTAGDIKMVLELLKSKAISRLTAVKMLIELGLSIEDAAAEVEAIESEDFSGAKELADAVGSEEEAAKYLGREGAAPPPPPEPPSPELPPVPPAPTT